MPRQRMEPGEHGRITERVVKTKTPNGSHSETFYATTYVRDSDGKRRRVERSSLKSGEDARRLLQRHLKDRRPPVAATQEVTERTTLSELFEIWIVAKAAEDGVSEQTAGQYRQVWTKHAANQLGALRIREVDTTVAHGHVQRMGATTQAKRLRMILLGMFSMAVRFGVIAVNPIRETKPTKAAPKEVTRKISSEDLERVRAASGSTPTGRVRVRAPAVYCRRSWICWWPPARGPTRCWRCVGQIAMSAAIRRQSRSEGR